MHEEAQDVRHKERPAPVYLWRFDLQSLRSLTKSRLRDSTFKMLGAYAMEVQPCQTE